MIKYLKIDKSLIKSTGTNVLENLLIDYKIILLTKIKLFFMKLNCFKITILLFSISLFSCKKSDVDRMNQSEQQSQQGSLPNDYVSLIAGMGFNVDSIVEYADFFIVENDIMFSKSKLDAMSKKGSSNTNGRETQATNGITLTRPAVSNITVYVDPSIPIGGVDDWRAEITAAMNHWTSISNCIIDFTNGSSGADIIVRSDGNSLPNDTQASAEFPTNGNDPGFQIMINLDFYGNRTVTSAQKVYNMVHEFGHCIAFRHTNWNIRGESNAYDIGHGVPSTDPNSVMNGGTALNSWAGFSVYDVLAAELVYPQWADYVQLGGAVWYGTEAVTSYSGWVYAINNSRFYQINPNNGSYIQLGGAVWAGTNAMTALNNYIYAVNNSRIYRIDPNNGSYTQIGGAVWTGTNAMTSLNGFLYLVQNSRFYRVNPNDGTYTQLGGAVWPDTKGMTTYNGFVYQVQNGRLYKVDPANGNYTQLGGVSWSVNTEAISCVGNYLYIVENDMYYKVSPIDGSYVRLGGPVWAGTDGMTSIGTYNYVIENGRFYKLNSI